MQATSPAPEDRRGSIELLLNLSSSKISDLESALERNWVIHVILAAAGVAMIFNIGHLRDVLAKYFAQVEYNAVEQVWFAGAHSNVGGAIRNKVCLWWLWIGWYRLLRNTGYASIKWTASSSASTQKSMTNQHRCGLFLNGLTKSEIRV